MRRNNSQLQWEKAKHPVRATEQGSAMMTVPGKEWLKIYIHLPRPVQLPTATGDIQESKLGTTSDGSYLLSHPYANQLPATILRALSFIMSKVISPSTASLTTPWRSIKNELGSPTKCIIVPNC